MDENPPAPLRCGLRHAPRRPCPGGYTQINVWRYGCRHLEKAMRYLNAEELLAISFVRSGLHTLTLGSVGRYGRRLVDGLNVAGEWELRWGGRYLEGVRAGFVELDDEVAELQCDIGELCGVLDRVDADVLRVAEQTEWME